MARVRMAVAVVLALGAVGVVAPKWYDATRAATSRGEVVAYQDTIDWAVQNIPKNAVVAVDSNMWYDLQKRGYTHAVWFYKLDLDPAVQKQYVPDGYDGIDYVVLRRIYVYIARDTIASSVIGEAVQNGDVLAEFGDPRRYASGSFNDIYTVYKVRKAT